MPPTSARRSFHGPLFPTLRPEARLATRRCATSARSREPGGSSASESAVGRAVLQAARVEAPSSSQRERVLAGVLAALRRLTRSDR